MKAKVDLDKCIGCGKCEISCPEEDIFVDKKARVEEEKCRGCGSCTVQCDRQAVVLAD